MPAGYGYAHGSSQGDLAAGITPIAHGLLDRATFSGAPEASVQYLASAAMIGASAGWAVVRARWTHSRVAKAWALLNAPPDQQP